MRLLGHTGWALTMSMSAVLPPRPTPPPPRRRVSDAMVCGHQPFSQTRYVCPLTNIPLPTSDSAQFSAALMAGLGCAVRFHTRRLSSSGQQRPVCCLSCHPITCGPEQRLCLLLFGVEDGGFLGAIGRLIFPVHLIPHCCASGRTRRASNSSEVCICEAGRAVWGSGRMGMAWHCMSQHCMALHGIAWQGMALHGIAWQGMALHGRAWHCMAGHGRAWQGFDHCGGGGHAAAPVGGLDAQAKGRESCARVPTASEEPRNLCSPTISPTKLTSATW